LAYHLDLTLANLAGSGRELHVLASRPEGWSQELRLSYREPFLFSWPLDAGLDVRQRVQDSTWVELEVGVDTGWEPLPGWRVELGVSLQDLAPDSLNGYWLAGVDASQARRARLTLKADQRDDPRNPRRGWKALLEESWIQRDLSPLLGLPPRGRDLDLRRQTLQAWSWLPLGHNQVLATGAGAGRFQGQAPGLEDEFRLGGQDGPRGWREQSIRARQWGLGQLEWRYLLGPAARTALFWDWLLWRDAAGVTHRGQGRGGALVLPVRQGQLDLQYALQPGQRWREGLLHVRVVTRF
jgi:outer membrane protein assembly factor BamA